MIGISRNLNMKNMDFTARGARGPGDQVAWKKSRNAPEHAVGVASSPLTASTVSGDRRGSQRGKWRDPMGIF